MVIEGFVVDSDNIQRVGPLHAFDNQSLSQILSDILKGTTGAILKFILEAIEPDDCVNYVLKERSFIEVFGDLPSDLEEELRRKLEDGS